MSISIALAGNPNSGKTTLFNALTGAKQYVGNWPGVTVERKEGVYVKDKEQIITDLPGVYSLSPYTLEEAITREFLLGGTPDVVINIVDATNLERNLYLTTQILDLGIPVVVALNMIDLVRKNGNTLDADALSKELGCPVVEISALHEEGIDTLMQSATAALQKTEQAPARQRNFNNIEILLSAPGMHTEDEIEAAICKRYDAIEDICAKCVQPLTHTTTQKIDSIVTSRVLGIPIFIALMFFIYYLTINIGGGILLDSIGEGIEAVSTLVSESLTAINSPDWLQSLLIDGIIAGVGAVIGFVPQLAILFLLLGFLERCGYLSRVAFMMDRLFRRFGLSGKSIIPMLISSGCGVPAIMATKTIRSQSERRLTIMTTTMIPCGAKLPIIALVFGALAGSDSADFWWVAPLFYFLGIAAIAISCIMLKKLPPFAGKEAPFIMELPNYHLPTIKSVLISMWERVKSFIVKAGTIILFSTIVIWFLMNFGMYDGQFGLLDPEMEDYLNYSLIAGLGNALAWIFTPLGFGNWESTVTAITGLVAKENVVATVGILTSLGEVAETDPSLWTGFAAMFGGSMSAIMAFCAFNLLCAPCFAAIGAIRRQMNSAKWTWAAIGYMCIFAWCSALMIYQFGNLAAGEQLSFWTVAAILIAAAMLFQIFRPTPKCSKNNDEGQNNEPEIINLQADACTSCATCKSCESNKLYSSRKSHSLRRQSKPHKFRKSCH